MFREKKFSAPEFSGAPIRAFRGLEFRIPERVMDCRSNLKPRSISKFSYVSGFFLVSSGTTPNISDSTTIPNPDISAPVAARAPSQFPEQREQQQRQQQQRQQHGLEQGSTSLNSRSCITCRRRKVRCNKKSPCSNCAKAGVECVFPAPGRAPRKSKRPSDSQLHSRLRRLENVIEKLNMENKNNSNSNSNNDTTNNTTNNTITVPMSPVVSPRWDDNATGINSNNGPQEEEHDRFQAITNRDPENPSPHALHNEFGRLVVDHGRSRYVSNRLWASLGDEIEELQDVLEQTSSDDSDYPYPGSSTTSSTSGDGFLFGFSSLAHSLHKYHPSPAHVPILWSAYEENVAPIISMLHRPTARRIVMEVSTNPDKLDKISETLVLAIYFAAVVTMSAEQYWSRFGEHRSVAVGRYRFAVEQALARANFLNTQNLMLLQAAVLFLFSVRPVDDTNFVWSMTAVVVRLAQGLGLHRDGTNFGLKPFETEMRRRLWWHVCLLDMRSAEEHGTDTIIQEKLCDVRLPLNINDDDISPGMVDFPQERVGCTEMTFTLTRCEMASYIRHVSSFFPGGWSFLGGGSASVEESERWIRSINEHIEEKYIKNLDQNIPIYWLCAVVVRIMTGKLWLIIHYPMVRCDHEASPSRVPRSSLLLTAVELIESTIILTRHESTAKWSWIAHVYMQWQAIALVLSEIRARPACPLTERAWIAVSAMFEEWEKDVKRRQKKEMMWIPIKRLMRRTAAARAKQQKELQAKSGDQSTKPTQGSQCVVSPLQLGSEVYSSPTLFLPRIYGLPTSDRVPASAQQEGTTTTNTGQCPRLVDLSSDQMSSTYGSSSHSNDLFMDQNTPGNANSFTPVVPSQQQPYPTGMSAFPDVHEDAMTAVGAQQDWATDMDIDWAEWDKVMREFQMDVEKEKSGYSMGIFTDWLA